MSRPTSGLNTLRVKHVGDEVADGAVSGRVVLAFMGASFGL